MNKKEYKVLILMAAFNGSKYIGKQIESIIGQNKVKISLLISVDKSTDNTLSICKAYEKKYSNIKVIENTGIFHNRKRKASDNFYFLFLKCQTYGFDFIGFSDQDDIFLPNKYIDAISKMKTYYSGYSSSVRILNTQRLLKQQNIIESGFDYHFEGAGQGCTFLLKADCFNQLLLFFKKNYKLLNSFYYHDWLVYLFFRISKYKWFYDPNPSTLYRIHDNNVIGDKYSLDGIKKRFFLLFNGWYYAQIKKTFQIKSLILSEERKPLSCLMILKISITNGRRKFSDRIICSLSILFSKNYTE